MTNNDNNQPNPRRELNGPAKFVLVVVMLSVLGIVSALVYMAIMFANRIGC